MIKLIPVYDRILIDSSNLEIKPCEWDNIRNLSFEFYATYPNRVDESQHIYFRRDHKIGDETKELTCRFLVKPDLSLELDFNWHSGGIHLGKASHNFSVFKNKNEELKAVGGQAIGLSDLIGFKASFKDNDLINSLEYDVHFPGYDKILNPKMFSPEFANGLYIFHFGEGGVEKVTRMPTLSGIHPGRMDAHYGRPNNVDISASNGGLSVYDSPTSLIYSNKENQYYLYQRANIGTGYRNIQVASSRDLINWTSFQILKFTEEFRDIYFKGSIYHPNMFRYKDFEGIFSILPVTRKNSSDYFDLNDSGDYILFYSDDYINFHPIGPIFEYIYHFTYICNGPPFSYENGLALFIFNRDGMVNIFKNKSEYLTRFSQKYRSIDSVIRLKKAIFSEQFEILVSNLQEKNSISIKIHNEDSEFIYNLSKGDIVLNAGNHQSHCFRITGFQHDLKDPMYMDIIFNGFDINAFSGLSFN